MNRLIQLRKENKVTQEDIAKILGISRQAYSNYELGNREPDIDVLKKIAEYYDVSIDYLLERTDKKRASKLDELNIPQELLDVSLAFHNGGVEDLTQDEIYKIVDIIKIMRGKKDK